MQLLIERAIEAEAKKRISNYSRDRYYSAKYRALFRKRTKKKPKPSSNKLPPAWTNHHRHFDPRYCHNHARFIARGIWKSLQAGSYSPLPSIRVTIPKPSGGFRCIDAFSIPDAAIAKIFLNNLRIRNSKIFSDSSYAYQYNKTPLDAVIRLKSILSEETIFISQYDFSRYFDSIKHSYLKKVVGKEGPFLTTTMERQIMKAVAKHSFQEPGGSTGDREVGIPQGNSLSLFLANAAAHALDMELAMLNGAFARFADDSVVVNRSYEDALKCADAFLRFSDESGVDLNAEKSKGIRIFSETPMEMAHISEFDFLSYKFKRSGLHVSNRAVANIKRRCARIIYNHLLLYPRRVKAYNPKRLGRGFRDWDLVTCVNELRAFVYGGQRQSTLDAYLAGQVNLRNLSGAVSYFSLVEDSAIFRELDGWLVDVVYRAYQARVGLLAKLGSKKAKPISKDAILTGAWYKYSALPMETRAPSFFTAWRASRKSWLRHGLGGINAQGGYSY